MVKELIIIFLLLIFSCTPQLWTRPHPDDPSMPYDTLAYEARRGDEEAHGSDL